jgi:hypothetical protein
MTGISINTKKYDKAGSKLSSSYSSSFSDNVSVVGNQIQIESTSNQQSTTEYNLADQLPILNSSFKLKFSEKDLKQ